MLLQHEGMIVSLQRITPYDRPKSRNHEISKCRQHANGHTLGCANSRLDRFSDHLGTSVCLCDRLTYSLSDHSLTDICINHSFLNFLGQCCGACPFVLSSHLHFDRFNSHRTADPLKRSIKEKVMPDTSLKP